MYEVLNPITPQPCIFLIPWPGSLHPLSGTAAEPVRNTESRGRLTSVELGSTPATIWVPASVWEFFIFYNPKFSTPTGDNIIPWAPKSLSSSLLAPLEAGTKLTLTFYDSSPVIRVLRFKAIADDEVRLCDVARLEPGVTVLRLPRHCPQTTEQGGEQSSLLAPPDSMLCPAPCPWLLPIGLTPSSIPDLISRPLLFPLLHPKAWLTAFQSFLTFPAANPAPHPALYSPAQMNPGRSWFSL